MQWSFSSRQGRQTHWLPGPRRGVTSTQEESKRTLEARFPGQEKWQEHRCHRWKEQCVCRNGIRSSSYGGRNCIKVSKGFKWNNTHMKHLTGALQILNKCYFPSPSLLLTNLYFLFFCIIHIYTEEFWEMKRSSGRETQDQFPPPRNNHLSQWVGAVSSI